MNNNINSEVTNPPSLIKNGGLEEVDKMISQSIKSQLNELLYAVGNKVSGKVSQIFNEELNDLYKRKIIEYIDEVVQGKNDDIEKHLNRQRPNYTIRKKSKGGNRKTKKNINGGNFSEVVSNLSGLVDMSDGMTSVQKSIDSCFIPNKFNKIMTSSFYNAMNKSPHFSNWLKRERQKIVNHHFNMDKNYTKVKDAILNERCNKKNITNRKKECKYKV